MSPEGGPSRTSLRLRLKKDLRRALKRGAPWIFRDALAPAPAGLDDGALVLIAGRDGRPIGRGFYSRSGPIAVRMLTLDSREDIAELVAERLRLALARRRSLLAASDTNAFRWVHGEADRLPGVHVDLYDCSASVLFDGSGARAFYLRTGLVERLVELARPLELDAIVERGSRNEEARPLWGNVPDEPRVRENGLHFAVDLRHGQKGGLFLDQRENRARVRELSRGRSLLNLFGYTGAFSIYGAAGGATSTTTVDLSKPAIRAARRNFELNAARFGDRTGNDHFVAADAYEFLASAEAKHQAFELVISDPPSFAPKASAREPALAAYRKLHALAVRVVAPGGTLCAASCSSHVNERDFVETLRAGAARAGRRVEVSSVHGAASDHPVIPEFPEGAYLKFVIARVG